MDGAFYKPTLFETESPEYDQHMSRTKGRVFTLLPEDISGDGKVNIDDLRWEYLEGDGDFRSAEVTAFRDEADMVITNPPFSLFRKFLLWMMDGATAFSIIGSDNAVTYKEVFPLFRENRLWKGATASSTDMVFEVPEEVEIKESDRLKAERMGYKGHFTRLGNSGWFTNIEHGRRHEPLELMTTADNLKFSKHNGVRDDGYRTYDNYEAIEVGYVDAIPSDHGGVMGVPITFLDKYNPDQFVIVGLTQRGCHDEVPDTKKYDSYREMRPDGTATGSSGGKTNENGNLVGNDGKRNYFVNDAGHVVQSAYKRIFIQAKGQ